MELKKYILFPLMIFTIYGSAQCDRNLDSLILVDLYNNTGGPDWTIPWNLAQPMDTWYGIVLTKAGCVKCIDLDGSDNCIGIDYNNLGNNLSGEIPESIGNLKYCHFISLGNNALSGTIPASIGQMLNLNDLILRFNNLSGTIPPEIANLEFLHHLNLRSNQLSGQIPEEFGFMENLRVLFLLDNQLTGNIPSSFSNFKLVSFSAADNQLSGEIPAFLGGMIASSLDLSNNYFHGCFPEELRNLCSREVSFAGNISLPWQGDFYTFCNTINQIGAPCDDGIDITENVIDANCNCSGIISDVEELESVSIRISPNPTVNHLIIQSELPLEHAFYNIEGYLLNRFEASFFDISIYQEGLYILVSTNEITGQKRVTKIIKQ